MSKSLDRNQPLSPLRKPGRGPSRGLRAFFSGLATLLLLSVVAVSAGSCGDGSTLIILNVSGANEQVISLQPLVSVDGMPAKLLPATKDRFDVLALRLPVGTKGRVHIDVEATGSSTCVIAQAAAEFDATGQTQIELPITLVFMPTPLCPLSVELGGTKMGSIVSDPAGIDCGSVCRVKFAQGYRVRLSAKPSADSYLSAWEGVSCKGDICELQLNTPYKLTAVFSSKTMFMVTKGGDGIGTVTSDPAGVDCGTQCTLNAAIGTDATLIAKPNPDSFFEGWSGGCSGTDPCKVKVGTTQSVVAVFRKKLCTVDGLCWENPLPFGRQFEKVFGFAEDDIWAVGDRATVVRKQGTNTTVLPRPTMNNITLRAIWGATPMDVWVGGDDGLLYRWNGTTWTQVNRPGAAGPVYDIFGLDASTIWAVAQNTVVRFDGTNWVLQAIPGGSFDLRGVHASATNNVWAVGIPNVILRYDGNVWTQLGSPLPGGQNIIYDVWTFANNNTFISSAYTPNNIWYWNGSMFRGFSVGTSEVTSLFALNATNVFGVGASFVGTGDSLAWSTEALSSNVTLRSVWSSKANTYWVSGNGAVIQSSEALNLPKYRVSDSLFKGFAIKADDIWAVGGENLAHYDGISWNVTRGPWQTNSNYRGVWGSSSNDVWASDFQKAQHWDGKTWTAFAAPIPANGYRIWGADANTVFMTADNGTIVRWDGTRWRSHGQVTTNQLLGIWGTDAVNIWAVGCGGTVLFWNGLSWTRNTAIPMSDTSCFYDVHGTGPNNVVAVSDNFTWRWDGMTWTRLPSAGGGYGVAVRAANDIYVSQVARIMRHDGTTPRYYDADTNSQLHNPFLLPNNEILFFGNNSSILRLRAQ